MNDTDVKSFLKVGKRIIKTADRRGDWTPEEATICHSIYDVVEAYKRHKQQTAQVAVVHNVTAEIGG